jgi:hypothetical protein
MAWSIAAAACAAEAADSPAPVNPYHGMQERVETFAFAQKPAAKKDGEKWVITFATTANCDATVTIIDKDGNVVRHLASGVLGKNAPHPFQQNSLSQKLVWDGQTDDFRMAPAGCTARVSLGLKPEFDKTLWWDPYDIPVCDVKQFRKPNKVLVGTTSDDGRVVAGVSRAGATARVFDKDWKYVKTVFPPPADKMVSFCTEANIPLATTKWGDKVPIVQSFWGGGYYRLRYWGDKKRNIYEDIPDLEKAMTSLGGASEVKAVLRDEAKIPRCALPQNPRPWPKDIYLPMLLASHNTNPRITVDPARELVYAAANGNCGMIRFDGRTGKLDEAWPAGGKGTSMSEHDMGPDGLLYFRWGRRGRWLSRVDENYKLVPFASENEESIQAADALKAWKHGGGVMRGFPKDMNAVYTGYTDNCNVHEKGFDVSVNGRIVSVVELLPRNPKSADWMIKHGLLDKDGKINGKLPPKGGSGAMQLYVVVWDRDGKVLSADAVVGNIFGHGVRMDRDGNIYRVFGGVCPPGKTLFDGLTNGKGWNGMHSIVKFRGGPYPVGTLYSDAPRARNIPFKSNKGNIPSDALKLQYGKKPAAAAGGLWVYGPVSTDTTNGCCSCYHQRFDLDDWARLWVPNLPCCSVMILDSNGNRILRMGTYGNVDDEGTRFTWPSAVAVSNEAAYVLDRGNRRILRAVLKYEVEEEVTL